MTSKKSVTNLIPVEALFLIRHCGGLGVMKFSAVTEFCFHCGMCAEPWCGELIL